VQEHNCCARAEETVLYRALIGTKNKETQTHGEEGFIEHELVDIILKNLSATRDKMSPEFGAGAKVLKELISHHVREEEGPFFSAARAEFPVEQRQVMNRTYLTKKKAVKVP
jgi:hypothetical protein